MGIELTIRKWKELGPKQFFKQWGKGVASVKPLDQTKIQLWSFLPMVAGITWGITVTFLGKTYWLTLILSGSLPLTLINIISTYQKYKKLKQVDDTMKMLEKEAMKKQRRKKK